MSKSSTFIATVVVVTLNDRTNVSVLPIDLHEVKFKLDRRQRQPNRTTVSEK